MYDLFFCACFCRRFLYVRLIMNLTLKHPSTLRGMFQKFLSPIPLTTTGKWNVEGYESPRAAKLVMLPGVLPTKTYPDPDPVLTYYGMLFIRQLTFFFFLSFMYRHSFSAYFHHSPNHGSWWKWQQSWIQCIQLHNNPVWRGSSQHQCHSDHCYWWRFYSKSKVWQSLITIKTQLSYAFKMIIFSMSWCCFTF